MTGRGKGEEGRPDPGAAPGLRQVGVRGGRNGWMVKYLGDRIHGQV